MNSYILVTGASSGIGKGVAVALSKDHPVILVGRNYEKLCRVREECYLPERHLIWCCDLERERLEVFHSLTAFLQGNEGVVRAFVHCAGVTKILPLRNFQPEYVDRIFNTNVFSALEILRVLLKKTNKGCLENIVFISALWSVRGDVGNSVYAASKGALNSLVYSLAQELAPRVRVNVVSPGAILTPMTESLLQNEEFRKKVEKEYPLGIGSVEDVVHCVLFLLSPESKWITGQNYLVDGGRSTK
nr:SDR family oxidoreductase [Odoribacter splanchnicus]